MSDIEKPSEATEMYLITIYRLTRQAENASTKAIAGLLGVSLPTVSERLKRLSEQGYVVHEWREGATLTSKGKKIALNVLRKHRLVETFLVRFANYRLDEIHDEACNIEHAMSDRLADQLERLLDYPALDPHGHPIPQKTGEISSVLCPKLNEAQIGDEVCIQQVSDWDKQELTYLIERGLVPGKKVKVLDIAPSDGPLTLELDQKIMAVAAKIAASIGISICSSS